MMLDTFFFKFILFCFKLMTVNEPVIEMQLHTPNHQKVIVYCEKIPGGGIIYTTRDNVREIIFRFEETGNGVFNIKMPSEQMFSLALADILTKVNKNILQSKKQEIRDDDGNLIVIKPTQQGISIEVAARKIKAAILKKFIR